METEFCDQPLGGYKKGFSFILSSLALLLFSGSIYAHNIHTIEMQVKRINPGNYLAYRMHSHCVKPHTSADACGAGNHEDITNRYSTIATMPGPTIVVTEEDEISIKLFYMIESPVPTADNLRQVSLHVHGVHYLHASDGTLEYINENAITGDQSAKPAMTYTYNWTAAEGTAGTWAYHDHNFKTHNGGEDRGMYGALIVNPASGVTEAKSGGNKQSIAISDITKENVLYLLDDTFAGMQIDNTSNMHSTADFNPTFTADKNTFVRFHVISLGTNAHKFQLSGYNWIDPGTRDIINMKPIGSLEKHFFTVRTKQSATYSDNTFFGKLLGMEGSFQIN